MKLKGLLVIDERDVDIFDEGKSTMRDNSMTFLRDIRRLFFNYGVELVQDRGQENEDVDFEIHLEIPRKQQSLHQKKYLMRFGSSLIRPISYKKKQLSKYQIVFSWNDDGVNKKNFIKTQTPNKISIPEISNFDGRSVLCCMIAGNKALGTRSPLDLYSERVKTIKWFEQNAPHDFVLYGKGWNNPVAQPGFCGRVKRKLRSNFIKHSNKCYFLSYQGEIHKKADILTKSYFNICYENVKDCSGYITEEIFDSFFSGCVPIYWGAPDINKYIPQECFIDRRNFKSHEDLYSFIKSINRAEYEGYLSKILDFLKSEEIKIFSDENFSKLIVTSIAKDLNLQLNIENLR